MYFAAGYNHFEVAEFLLENGADVNAQDKGGLIPLHNAASYGVSQTSAYQRYMYMASIRDGAYIFEVFKCSKIILGLFSSSMWTLHLF